MNLSRLFKMQQKLDEHIIKEHGLEGQNLLPEKILALQVELGECANEWRGFKFWSRDREPRKMVKRPNRKSTETYWYNPLLEEYVDCLHFILSIGLELGADELLKSEIDFTYMAQGDITKIFSTLLRNDWVNYYFDGFEYFMTLFKELGFTWEEIEEAYLEKNKENHRRQESGY